MIRLHILNAFQENLFGRIQRDTGTTRVSELGIVTRSSELEFKGLANTIRKPPLLRQLLVVIGDVDGVRSRKVFATSRSGATVWYFKSIVVVEGAIESSDTRRVAVFFVEWDIE